MSQWFDQSNNANKLRQSYLKGFLDISGGGIYVRSDNSLNFYTTADGINPNFAVDATELRVKGKQYASDSIAMVDISNEKLAFLKDLSENVQLQMDQLYHRTQYIRSDSSANETDPAVNDAIIHIKQDITDVCNNKIYVAGSILPKYGETYDLGSSELPFGDIYLKKNTIHFDQSDDGAPESAMSFNTVTGTLDLSFNGKLGKTVLSYDSKVAIGHSPDNRSPSTNLDVSGTALISGDVSFNTKLSVGGDVSMNSKLEVTDDATLSSKLIVMKDASLNSKLYVAQDASLNAKLSVADDATLSSKLIVMKDASLNSKLYVALDASLNAKLSVTDDATLSSKLFVSNDVSFDTKMSVGGDVSMNSNVDISGDLVIKGNLSVYQNKETMVINTTINNYEILSTQDISLNGNLVVSSDVSLNSKLFTSGDVSFNSNLAVGHNIELKNEEDGKGFILQY